MKKYVIFGDPVSHSKSPNMQNAGFKKIGYDGVYEKYHLEEGNQIKQVFLDNGISGANITVPHKEAAFENADEVIGLAKKIGAVNTYINDHGRVKAYNTDAPGFMKAIEEYGKIDNAVILGAGGTAKAIAVAFCEAEINTIVINRSRKNRLEFFEEVGCTCYNWEEAKKDIDSISHKLDTSSTLIVNSTSAGLKDDLYPAPLEILTPLMQNAEYAVDCIYGKITPFLALAKEYGLKSKDGEDMLLYQGVLAFELFTSTKADKQLIEAMRRGLKGS